jgi:hypothetical protein
MPTPPAQIHQRTAPAWRHERERERGEASCVRERRSWAGGDLLHVWLLEHLKISQILAIPSTPSLTSSAFEPRHTEPSSLAYSPAPCRVLQPTAPPCPQRHPHAERASCSAAPRPAPLACSAARAEAEDRAEGTGESRRRHEGRPTHSLGLTSAVASWAMGR